VTLLTLPIDVPADWAAYCGAARARIQAAFGSSGDAGQVLSEHSALADAVVTRLYAQHVSAAIGPERKLCLVAVGGYGRKTLFPHSDLDLLFLFDNTKTEAAVKAGIAEMARILWDARFRVSTAARTIEECAAVREDNVEFHISLLDRRLLAGDQALFEKFDKGVMPATMQRERTMIVKHLAELARQRYEKYGHTIFNLEPNTKESPGGLRDYHLACWLLKLTESARAGAGKDSHALREQCRPAVAFLSAVRCFQHYRTGRDDNVLTYELQDEAAQRGVGCASPPKTPEEWMRLYFRCAGTIQRASQMLLDEAQGGKGTLRRRLARWSARRKGAEFFVVDGQTEVREPGRLAGRDDVLRLLAFLARTGAPPSFQTEREVRTGVKGHAQNGWDAPGLWPDLRGILAEPYPGAALRLMHRAGLLTRVLPEFRAIDTLVVRDFYHRYTVDEHTLRTIEHLERLADPLHEWEEPLAGLWKQLEQRELLVLTMLLHDIGKGISEADHVDGSLAALATAGQRLGLEHAEREEVHFLIAHHLEMSATMQRRDIFDPETIGAFAESAGTLERLGMLCLLTYADIHAVNPEALTPWKAEMLWQLYAATANHLSRSLDRERVHAAAQARLIRQISEQLAGKCDVQQLESFLEGFPKRYMAIQPPERIAAHYRLALGLAERPVQVEIEHRRRLFELTLVTKDRPALFATIAGVMAAWGMNIVKADAFGNAAGIVLDTFHFEDLHRTLELNPSEVERFRGRLAEVIVGRMPVKPMLEANAARHRAQAKKVSVATQVRFDDSCSSHSTLLELITQDRPGLLHQIGSTLASNGCNIEVALIDTEGQKATDVFYLTREGSKLDAALKQRLQEELLNTL
jgi:[protein-PII] uridylyltransferase